MSIGAYDYCPRNPSLRTPPFVKPVPPRSEGFEQEVLTKLAAIKETLDTVQTTTTAIETRLTTVEKLTNPIYRAFRLIQGI